MRNHCLVQILFFSVFMVTISSAQNLHIEGKAKISILDKLNTADSVVVVLADGTLAMRDVATLTEFQVLSISNDTIYLTNGGFVVLPADEVDDADHDPTNELQTWSTLPGIPLAFLDGLDNVDDLDADPTNEIQTISRTGTTVTLSDGGGTFQDSVLDETAVDNFVGNNGYLTSENDGDATNELQTISRTGLTVTLSDGGGTFQDSVLDETAVDNFVGNNGYLTSEVDGDPTNEIQTISRTGTTVTLSDGGGTFQDSVLDETAVDNFVANNGYLTSEVDGDPNNEKISSMAVSGDSLTVVEGAMTHKVAVDSSNTNEIQSLTISNDTVFLSGGGNVKIPVGVIRGTGANTKNLRAYDEGSVPGNARGENSVDLQTIRGAATQVASGAASFIGAGVSNTASGLRAVVGGGNTNTVSGSYGFIGGGFNNSITQNFGTIGGGYYNAVSNQNATVAGGYQNLASGQNSFIGGGYQNMASGETSTIAGGQSNAASGGYSSILGGRNLKAQSYGEVVVGLFNVASGGSNSYIATDPIFVIGNGTGIGYESNALLIRKNGFMGIGTNTPDTTVHIVGNLKMVDGNQADGKIMVSDANGVGSWQTLVDDDAGWTMNVDTTSTVKAVGIGTTSPSEKLEVDGAVNLGMNTGTTTEAGTIRWNATSGVFEGFNGKIWVALSYNSPWGKPTVQTNNFEIQKLIASDGVAGDQFSIDVDIQGYYAIVGAWANTSARGAAYVYFKDGETWTQQAKLTASDAADGDNFGVGVALSGDGSYAIIGAHQNDDAGNRSGSAYIFKRTGASWTEMQKLTASDAAAEDLFGASVAISDTAGYAVVGAPRRTSWKGAIYVFSRSGETWSQVTLLTATDGANGDYFGNEVAVSDTAGHIIAGAPEDGITVFGDDKGSAYIFKRTGATWTQEAKIIASDGVDDNRFGQSVDINGDRVIVGAFYRNNGVDNYTGAAYIFERSGTNWNQDTKLLASDGAGGDWFGYTVALDGNFAVIGAQNNDDYGSNSGSAYIFNHNGTIWEQQLKIVPSDGAVSESFGFKVAIDGNFIIIGAVNDGGTKGAAYIY